MTKYLGSLTACDKSREEAESVERIVDLYVKIRFS